MGTKLFDNVDFTKTGENRKLIIDNDAGVDDAWAISILSKVAVNLKHEILAMTCVSGNTTVDNVCKNNLYLLSKLNMTEVPVYKGAKSCLIQEASVIDDDNLEFFHGKNGFGDVSLPALKNVQSPQPENAIQALHRITSENKGRVTLCCTGPLTNIALAIKTYGDFVENVKDIFIMGGNRMGIGNTSASAEFNFHADPEAAWIVLREMQEKIVLLPWETCLKAQLQFDWRTELHKGSGPLVQFLNKIETPVLERQKHLGFKKYTTADQLLAATLVDPTIVTSAFKAHAFVELAGKETRGQVILDNIRTREGATLTIIAKCDPDKYSQLLTKLKKI